ncbi:MAG: metal-dependent phosphohydrolase [Cyanobacteria bacterium P01_C01_bin.73]
MLTVPMLTVLEITTIDILENLKVGYYQLFRHQSPQSLGFLLNAAEQILATLAQGNAPYHNSEHTILVAAVGQEILLGKQRREGNVTPYDWLHYMLALLCHDIGYVQGACLKDSLSERRYWIERDRAITLKPGATDASLAPHHIERSKQYAAEQFGAAACIDVALVQSHIERTRFPVPDHPSYQSTADYGGLARAADLIGQLSDPQYLQKTVALFAEFEETGANQRLGYGSSADLCAGYPMFFHQAVYPYLNQAVHCLCATFTGKRILADLYSNVAAAEQYARLN